MQSAGLTSALLRFSFLLLFLLSQGSADDSADEKYIRSSTFGSPLSPLQFFEDSEVVLATEYRRNIVHRSEDAGATWDKLEDLHSLGVILNPNDNKVAIAMGLEGKHWITYDQGKKWDSFNTDPALGLSKAAPFSFHASDSKKIIVNVGNPLEQKSLLTTDGFKKDPKTLREGAQQCMWAKEKAAFDSGDKDIDKNRILCVASPPKSGFIGMFDHRLYQSDDYFKEEQEAKVVDGRRSSGFVSMVSAGKYLMVAQRSKGTLEMAMYTSVDGNSWNRALFGQKKLEADGYTVMESTNYSIRVDVMEGDPSSILPSPMGSLYSSNSNGSFFTKNEGFTNRNMLGLVDFERLDAVQGVAIANIVKNPEDVVQSGAEKVLQSRITFNDGRDFEPLKGKRGDHKGDLNLHGYSEMRNQGKVYSNKGAPGILMGIGNLGENLHEYAESNLWVSSDGGENWRFAYEGPHKFEFADSGSILAAISDPGPTDHIKYSTDYGKEWKKLRIVDDDEDKVRPDFFTTITDSTSTKVVLAAKSGRGDDIKQRVFSIDFQSLDLKKCGKDDFEIWHARQSEDGEPGCVMGHTQSFRRIKADAKCFVDKEFEEAEPENKDCECAKEDYECDTGYVRSKDRESCIPEGGLKAPKGECEKEESTFMGPSGFRRIPGNTCKKNKFHDDIMKDVKRKCKDVESDPDVSDGSITSTIKTWDAKRFREYRYLEKPPVSEGSEEFEDETILAITEDRKAWKTRDHGKHWEHLENIKEAKYIYPNTYESRDAYIVTASKKVFYTDNRGKSFHSFEAKSPANDRNPPILRFHPSNRQWLIWTGCKEDDSADECSPLTHYTQRRGLEWHSLIDDAGSCEFVWRDSTDAPQRNISKETVFCTKHEGRQKSLLSGDDFFKEEPKTLFENIENFATMSEFIIVATRGGKEHTDLGLNASVDAQTFAPAKFPPQMSVTTHDGYDGYTVLDSSSHSIFLHATVNSQFEREYGHLVKSNSNGTSFVTSLKDVNRNKEGYADFEKLQAIEGAALANKVSNVEEVRKNGVAKERKSMITHNDGADWSPLSHPDCGSQKGCSLHLHGYTERRKPDESYSSPSAVGLVIGIGNVGTTLQQKRDGDTYISRDGGMTWSTAVEGQYMWEFGDQGSIIVLVQEREPTSKVKWSKDEGRTWNDYYFSDEDKEYDIHDISTIPSDGSLNFLLWGREPSGKKRAVTINLDFTGAFDRKCKFDKDHENDDYYLWQPEHPFEKNGCLFGHKNQWVRKKAESTDCYNGPRIERFHRKIEDCPCTDRDFECDYNFERDDSGLCKSVGPERDPVEDCKADPETNHYFKVTGYRRIPGDTCTGGNEQDRMAGMAPCPNREDSFRKQFGTSGWLVLFIVLICAAAAAGIGWFVYQRFMAGGAGPGRIRLGESDGYTTSQLRLPMPNLDTNSAFVRYPVMGVSALAATLMAVPMVLMSGGRWARDKLSGRGRGTYSRLGGGSSGGWSSGGGSRTYTSRGSFARGRDWTGQASDESDLLGEDSDEDA